MTYDHEPTSPEMSPSTTGMQQTPGKFQKSDGGMMSGMDKKTSMGKSSPSSGMNKKFKKSKPGKY